jgi:hypothetical protein
LKEPRHYPQSAVRSEEHESALAAIRALLAKPAYRHIIAAIVAYCSVAYGAMAFIYDSSSVGSRPSHPLTNGTRL